MCIFVLLHSWRVLTQTCRDYPCSVLQTSGSLGMLVNMCKWISSACECSIPDRKRQWFSNMVNLVRHQKSCSYLTWSTEHIQANSDGLNLLKISFLFLWGFMHEVLSCAAVDNKEWTRKHSPSRLWLVWQKRVSHPACTHVGSAGWFGSLVLTPIQLQPTVGNSWAWEWVWGGGCVCLYRFLCMKGHVSLQHACLKAHACAFLSLFSQRQLSSPLASVLPPEEISSAYFGIIVQAAREKPDTYPSSPHSVSPVFRPDPHLPLLPPPSPHRRRGPLRAVSLPPPRPQPTTPGPHRPPQPRAAANKPAPAPSPSLSHRCRLKLHLPLWRSGRRAGPPGQPRRSCAPSLPPSPAAEAQRGLCGALPWHHEGGPRPGGSGRGPRLGPPGGSGRPPREERRRPGACS